MDDLTTKMIEHICDDLCRFPMQCTENDLEVVCAECKMGKFICDILNKYNTLADKNKWIPCSEELPKETGCYLTTIKCEGKDNDMYNSHRANCRVDCDGYYLIVEKRVYQTDRCSWSGYCDEVIAWQPLPTPYKEIESCSD